MEGGSQTQKKCGPEGEGRGPKGGRATSPGFWGLGLQGLGFRSECRFLGLWGLGFLGPVTLKLAKVGLAKVGQHLKTIKLASRFGQSRPSPQLAPNVHI